MRYYIMFFVTLIIVLIILFWNPYLGTFKNTMTIEYNFNEEGYSWKLDQSSNKLLLSNDEESKWVFKANKSGYDELNFYYTNGEDNMYHTYYKVLVIGRRIFWIDGYGEGLLDYPNPV